MVLGFVLLAQVKGGDRGELSLPGAGLVIWLSEALGCLWEQALAVQVCVVVRT